MLLIQIYHDREPFLVQPSYLISIIPDKTVLLYFCNLQMKLEISIVQKTFFHIVLKFQGLLLHYGSILYYIKNQHKVSI